MKSVLCMELRRAFKNKMFVGVVMVTCALALLAFFSSPGWTLSKNWLEYMGGNEQRVELFSKLKCMDSVLEIWMPRYGTANRFYYLLMTIMPVLCAIPYGASYLSDKKTGLINQLITRSGKRNYYIAKFITTFVSGGTIACIPHIVSLLVCMCFLPWGVPVRSTNLYPLGGSEVFADIFYTYPSLYVFLFLLYIFIMFGTINCICLSAVFIEENIFALYLTPFMLYFSSHVLLALGFGKGGWSLMRNSNMELLMKEDAWMIVLVLSVLFVVNISYLIRIRKDVL